jgi:uncharacterized protein YpiB (UPF0302 family)
MVIDSWSALAVTGNFVMARPSDVWNIRANKSLDGAMSEREQLKPEDDKDLPVPPDNASPHPTPPSAGEVALEPELQAFIGRQLLANFDDVLNEPVPDRFLELLRKLEQQQDDKP